MTPNQIQHRLQEAVQILASVDVPDDLRAVAFERVLDALGLGNGQPQSSQAPMDSPRSGDRAEDAHRAGASSLSGVEQRLGVSADQVSQVYEATDDGVRLIVRRAMLPEPARKAASMRAVALLVIAGRQAAGEEDWTPLAVVREECDELGVLDASNFAKEIGKLGWKYRGAGTAREARATRHHFEEAAELIRGITAQG